MLDFLAQRLPAVSRAQWLERLEAAEVVDEYGAVVTPQRAFQPGIRLYYYRSLPDEPQLPFEEAVLYQDEHLLVADKPHFMPVTPSGRYLHQTLLVRLKQRLGLAELSPLHRIDRETAGLVLFSVQRSAWVVPGAVSRPADHQTLRGRGTVACRCGVSARAQEPPGRARSSFACTRCPHPPNTHPHGPVGSDR